MEPTLRQLRAFVAVAEAQHFGRAAVEVGLAQPTLSKEIKLLERALGVVLLTRGPAGARLTEPGAALLPHAIAVLDATEQLLDAVDARLGQKHESVKVAATPSVVNQLLPSILRNLERARPDVTVAVLEVDTGGVPAAVREGRADIGLGHHVAAVEHCGRRTLIEDELFAVVHEELAEGARRIDLSKLSHVPILMWPREQNPEYHDALLRICRDRGLDPFIVTGSSRISGARSYLLREGRAFAIVPKDYAETEVAPLAALPLKSPATVPLQALWREPKSEAVDAVLRASKDSIAARSATN